MIWEDKIDRLLHKVTAQQIYNMLVVEDPSPLTIAISTPKYGPVQNFYIGIAMQEGKINIWMYSSQIRDEFIPPIESFNSLYEMKKFYKLS